MNLSHSKRLSLVSQQMMSAVGHGCNSKGFQVVLVTMLNLVYLCTQRKKQETLNVAKESDEKDCGIYSNADAYFARGVAWLCLKSLQAKYIIYIQNNDVKISAKSRWWLDDVQRIPKSLLRKFQNPVMVGCYNPIQFFKRCKNTISCKSLIMISINRKNAPF